jgi:hypothetical protein
MSIETERLVSDTPPTAEQLHKFASIGVRSAAARERLKTGRTGAHFLVDELDLMVDASDVSDEPSQVRHRVAMRVGAYPANAESEKMWSLRYINTYSAEAQPGVWLAERSTYSFQWTRSRMLVANRALSLIGFNTPRIESVEDALDTFRIDDDSVAILHASNQLQIVTDEDCEELIQDASEYFSTLNTANNA